jgi:transcriptional regulator with XRE-family HTH domain
MKKSKHGQALKVLLSRNIKQLRLHSGLSQAELAEKAGISIPYLGAVERGDKWPSPSTLAEIARSLGHEPYDLFIPESRSAQEVRKVIIKLEKDISDLIIQSTKLLNTIAKEGAETEKTE